mgnify:CR=1 FL=1|jgi:hypothetical protein|tara:strand:+ start:1843 stop:2583 length:741 start_codon:yes stop_codon:yes gene_type:complete
MAKFKYRIEGGRYGGELAVGEVSEDFAQYWAPIIEEEGTYETFIPHVLALSEWDDEEDINRDAPAIFEDLNEIEGWYAVDDIEHINGAYADGGFFVSNITDEEDEWAYDENEMEVEGYCLKGREGAYISTNTEPTSEEQTPVMLFHSAEKGGFASWFVESDEPFDPNKLVYSIVETHLGDFIEDVWYDKQLIEANFDYNDTTGKSYEAAVGWITTKWRDPYVDPADADLSEYWEDYDYEMEEENGS